MKTTNTILGAVIFAVLVTVVGLYVSSETPRTVPSPISGEQQRQIAELKKQVAGLEEKVNWLEERLTEPQRHKPSKF